MNARCFQPHRLQVVLVVIVTFSLAGCATGPASKAGPSSPLFDVEGTWSWVQDPWEGEFVLTKEGDAYAGTLDDVFEGTFGDKIADVEVSGDHIKFARYGKFGIQHWEGTLTEEDGRLKITDGQWAKGPHTGTFYAEKKQ